MMNVDKLVIALRYIAPICLALGIAYAVYLVVRARRQRMRCSASASATIVDSSYQEIRGAHGNKIGHDYYSLYQFSANGQDVRFASLPKAAAKGSIPLGKVARVHYNPEKPGDAYVDEYLTGRAVAKEAGKAVLFFVLLPALAMLGVTNIWVLLAIFALCILANHLLDK